MTRKKNFTVIMGSFICMFLLVVLLNVLMHIPLPLLNYNPLLASHFVSSQSGNSITLTEKYSLINECLLSPGLMIFKFAQSHHLPWKILNCNGFRMFAAL